MVEIWITVVTSIGCAILSTLITVFATLKIEKNKQKREDKKANQEKSEKLYASRPRFEIVKYIENKQYKKSGSSDLDILVLSIKSVDISGTSIAFSFNEDVKDSNNLVYFEYKLKNVGKTEIDFFTVASAMPKTVAAINLESKNILLEEHFINYETDCKKRFIKENDQVNVRVYYHKDEIISGLIGASLCIYMRDINGKMWMQPLFAPTKEIENSTPISFKEYKGYVDVDFAIDCFIGKSFW